MAIHCTIDTILYSCSIDYRRPHILADSPTRPDSFLSYKLLSLLQKCRVEWKLWCSHLSHLHTQFLYLSGADYGAGAEILHYWT